MANDEHVALLKRGVAAWNAWRDENPDIRPDLSDADLQRRDLRYVNFKSSLLIDTDLTEALLHRANFIGAECSRLTDLSEARAGQAKFSGVNLNGAKFIGANLSRAHLDGAHLIEADFSYATLIRTDLSGAFLTGARLVGTRLFKTKLNGADLIGARVYGASAWRVELDQTTKQQDLLISDVDERTLTVDNIEVAQFIYLLVDNPKIRGFIDTVTSQAVLILGRFTQERKPVLEALREELRQRKYLPILFDFEKPRNRNTDETITLLARMARFVVADISDAKSVLQELRAIVPDLPSVPVQPIILAMQEEPGMFDFYRNFRSFLNVHRYASQEQLIADLGEKVIRPAELKVLDLQGST
jgi:uncharacterized protein YjbI with pentapeptide repeats